LQFELLINLYQKFA